MRKYYEEYERGYRAGRREALMDLDESEKDDLWKNVEDSYREELEKVAEKHDTYLYNEGHSGNYQIFTEIFVINISIESGIHSIEMKKGNVFILSPFRFDILNKPNIANKIKNDLDKASVIVRDVTKMTINFRKENKDAIRFFEIKFK